MKSLSSPRRTVALCTLAAGLMVAGPAAFRAGAEPSAEELARLLRSSDVQGTLRLYESLPNEKRLWVFENAGHNSWPTWPNAAWWAEVMDWLSS